MRSDKTREGITIIGEDRYRSGRDQGDFDERGAPGAAIFPYTPQVSLPFEVMGLSEAELRVINDEEASRWFR
jgi:hypothetical protein